jgi:hypothetical protein
MTCLCLTENVLDVTTQSSATQCTTGDGPSGLKAGRSKGGGCPPKRSRHQFEAKQGGPPRNQAFKRLGVKFGAQGLIGHRHHSKESFTERLIRKSKLAS